MPTTTSDSSKDEENYDTLKSVQVMLAEALASLDKWSAFDLKENELKIKQQIKAHELAHGIISEVAQAVSSAISVVDQKHLERQGQ